MKTRRSADLNGVLVTLNDGTLCRLALAHWLAQGWIVVAPHSPLVAMAGPRLIPDLTLRAFCGEIPEQAPGTAPLETAGAGQDETDAQTTGTEESTQ